MRVRRDRAFSHTAFWQHRGGHRLGAVDAHSDGRGLSQAPYVGACDKQMGKFYELESSSPAMSLAPGVSQTHIHRSIHLKGDTKELEAITQKLFGVSLKELNF